MRRSNSKVAIISPKGINISTPNNTVEDGACEVLDNFRIKDGAWRNVGPFRFIDALGTFILGNYENARGVIDVLYKHPSASEGSYVAVVEVSHSGVAAGREIVNIEKTDVWEITHTFFAGEFQEVSVMHLGRLLILNIDGKMSHWRNKENTGNYSPTSLPQPASITLPEKVITSRPTPYVHTKGLQGNILKNKGNSTLLTAFPYYGYRGGDYAWFVYFPIINEQGVFMQPTVRNDWWWGEICFFAVFKTKDGHYVKPSALTIIASELDNAGQSEDKIMPYKEGLRYSYGTYDHIITETGIVDGKMQLQVGTMQGQNNGEWQWVERNDSELIGDYDTPTDGVAKSIGIFEGSGPNTPYSARLLANALMIAPVCKLEFDQVDNELIDSVVIFSTRIHPRWSAEALSQIWRTFEETDEAIIGETFAYEKLFAKNDLPNQPFYKILEVPHDMWGESSEGHYSLEIALTGTLLENAEQKEVWEPINSHELVYSSGKEINSMMHIFGEITQRFFDGYGSNGLKRIDTECEAGWTISTSFSIEDKFYCVSNPCGFDLTDATKRKNIISYPDYRAREIYNGSSFLMRNKYELIPALENNFAYYSADIFESETNPSALKYYDDYSEIGTHKLYYCKYPHRWKDTRFYIDGQPTTIGIAYMDASIIGGKSISKSSELRVSALSNPLVFPLSRTYQIGSDDNKIIAVNSAAIELSDEKIGEYPTWVFTKEGVFVGYWGNSDEVLYISFTPRTYDKICNPTTLTVNNSILFITKQGLMAISDRGSQLLSDPLNTLWGMPPEWLITADVLGWKYDTNEVIVASNNSPVIFVYNLGAGLWTTRRIIGDQGEYNALKLLNNQTLVAGSDILLFDIQSESSDDVSAVFAGSRRLVTRPIKFGECEFKRIETLIARLSSIGPVDVTLSIYGSIDGEQYNLLRTATSRTNKPIRLVRVPKSVRYVKIELICSPNADIEFTSFDIEYFNKFFNRLR